MAKYVKDFANWEALKNFGGYINVENTVTHKRYPIVSNGFIHSFEVNRFQNAKVKAVKGVGTTDITLYITNREWDACGYGGECDDNGFPIGYFD